MSYCALGVVWIHEWVRVAERQVGGWVGGWVGGRTGVEGHASLGKHSTRASYWLAIRPHREVGQVGGWERRLTKVFIQTDTEGRWVGGWVGE